MFHVNCNIAKVFAESSLARRNKQSVEDLKKKYNELMDRLRKDRFAFSRFAFVAVL